MLKFLIREKYPFKSEGDSLKTVEEISNGVIKDFYWKKIIEKMYDEKDIFVIKVKNQWINLIKNIKLKIKNIFLRRKFIKP